MFRANEFLVELALIVSIGILLAIGFFILVVSRKENSVIVKRFGYSIAVLFWIMTILLIFRGFYLRMTLKTHSPIFFKQMRSINPMMKKFPKMPEQSFETQENKSQGNIQTELY